LRGIDSAKDQSYVLYMLGQEQLQLVRFPIGEHTKAQVREMASRWGLPVAGKRDSQDVCFVRDQDYRRFLRTHAPESIHPGSILDISGRRIGQHQGLPFYTVGQRRGLGIAWSEPLYVLEIDAGRNALIVGPASQLGRGCLQVKDVSFVAGYTPSLPASVTIKVRYTGREVKAILHSQSGGTMNVRLATPVRDIAPGQAAVFYRGEILIGGGIIAEE
jgi:tRNA-specific 2-thiouridylase